MNLARQASRMTGDQLRAKLRELRLSQLDLARELGVTPTTVSRWRLGQLDVPRYAIAWLEQYERNR